MISKVCKGLYMHVGRGGIYVSLECRLNLVGLDIYLAHVYVFGLTVYITINNTLSFLYCAYICK